MFHSSRYELDMDFTPRRNRRIGQRRRTTSDPASVKSSSTKSSTSSNATIRPGLGSLENPDEDAVSIHRHSLDDATSEHAIKRVVLRHAIGLGKSHPYMNSTGPRGLAHRVARSEVEGIGGFWSRGVSARRGGSISHLKPTELEIISKPESSIVSNSDPPSTVNTEKQPTITIDPTANVNPIPSSSTLQSSTLNDTTNSRLTKSKRVPRPLPIPPASLSTNISVCVSTSPLGLDTFPSSITAPPSTQMKTTVLRLHSHPFPNSPKATSNPRERSSSTSSSRGGSSSVLNTSFLASSSPNLLSSSRPTNISNPISPAFSSSPQSSSPSSSSASPLSRSPSPSSSPPSSSSSSFPPLLPEITPTTPLVPNRPLSFFNDHTAPPLPKSPAPTSISITSLASKVSLASVSSSLSSSTSSTGTTVTVNKKESPNSNWSAINLALDASAPLAPLTPAFRSQSQSRTNGVQKQKSVVDYKKLQQVKTSSDDVTAQRKPRKIISPIRRKNMWNDANLVNDAGSPLLPIQSRRVRALPNPHMEVEPTTAQLASASVSAFVSAYAKANSLPVLDISAKNSNIEKVQTADEDYDLCVSEREGNGVEIIEVQPREHRRPREIDQKSRKWEGGKDYDRALYAKDKDKDRKRFPLFQKRVQDSSSTSGSGARKLLESSTSSEAIPIALPQLPPVPDLPPIYLAHSTFTPEELARLSAMTPKERRKSLRKRRTGLARIVVELAAGKQVASVLEAEALNGLMIAGENSEESEQNLAGREAVEVAAEISEILARLRKMKAS